MHPHQTSDGAPVDTEEDMMDLDSPLKVRTGALDGMDVDASEPPSYDAVGATRKQPAPVGGGESAACGATERRNVAAESSACGGHTPVHPAVGCELEARPEKVKTASCSLDTAVGV